MGKHKKPSWIKRLEIGYKKMAQKLHLEQSDVIDIQIPLNETQNLELSGCKAVTDRHSNKTMLTKCNAKITSNQVINPNSCGTGHQVSINLDEKDCDC